MPLRRADTGFTIIELLMVVVVIGVLAAIVIVSYNSIQQKASNARTTAAANQVRDLIHVYQALHGSGKLPGLEPQLPADADRYSGRCLTLNNECTNLFGTPEPHDNTALMTALKTVGMPPRTIDAAAEGMYGIYLDYNEDVHVNGEPAPYLMMYWLKGTNQNCGVPGVVVPTGEPIEWGVNNPWKTSPTGFSNLPAWGLQGLTYCTVSL